MWIGLKWASCVLTDAQGKVEQSHANIQSEEQDHIGHFTEEDDVPHMLLDSYCIREGAKVVSGQVKDKEKQSWV